MLKRGPRKASTMGVVVDSQLPHLVGMDDDILSTGVIIYHLRVGFTTLFLYLNVYKLVIKTPKTCFTIYSFT